MKSHRNDAIKIGISPSKKMFYLLYLKPFKNDETCFLFHLKISFHSKDIQIFVLTVGSYRKTALLEKQG